MDKQSLLTLLANNQLDELLFALKNRNGLHNELVLLEGQWNDLRAKQRHGLISTEQANIELSRLRKSLLELIELASGERPSAAAPLLASPRRPTITWLIAAGAVFVLLAGYFLYSILAGSPAKTTAGELDGPPASSAAKTSTRPAQVTKLDLSQAQPITFAAGDFQYERVYSIVDTRVESTGGGKSLITLTVGLNFKGIINWALGTESFRLVADELPGPLAPSNFLSTIVDSKSYEQGDIKFELSDDIRRFSIILEGKEDKQWHFVR